MNFPVRLRTFRTSSVIAVTLGTCAFSNGLSAQLRPTEPIQWSMYQRNATAAAELGLSRLSNQRASLAGTTGDLWELGNFVIAWRTGRVILEAAGTVQRRFSEQ